MGESRDLEGDFQAICVKRLRTTHLGPVWKFVHNIRRIILRLKSTVLNNSARTKANLQHIALKVVHALGSVTPLSTFDAAHPETSKLGTFAIPVQCRGLVDRIRACQPLLHTPIVRCERLMNLLSTMSASWRRRQGFLTFWYSISHS